jgi:hypothetical protein
MSEQVLNYNPEYAHMADENFKMVMTSLAAKKQMVRPVLHQKSKKGPVPVRGELLAGGILPVGCSYCSYKHTCFAEPKQFVEFSGSQPMYKTGTTQQLVLDFKKDYWGGTKPVHRVVSNA